MGKYIYRIVEEVNVVGYFRMFFNLLLVNFMGESFNNLVIWFYRVYDFNVLIVIK